MAKSVGCDAFGNGGFPRGIADLAGHGVVVQVVAGDPTGARVWGLMVIWWDSLFGFSDSVLSDSWAVCGGGKFMAKIENARSKTKLPR